MISRKSWNQFIYFRFSFVSVLNDSIFVKKKNFKVILPLLVDTSDKHNTAQNETKQKLLQIQKNKTMS